MRWKGYEKPLPKPRARINDFHITNTKTMLYKLRYIAIISLFALLVGCAGMGTATTEQARSLQQGMTEREVVERLGRPQDINRSDYGDYETAQFVYQSGMYEYIYVYFEDYRLTSVQY